MVASEAEGRAEALRRIAACRAAKADELDLGGLLLTALGGKLLAALRQLGWLRGLVLGLRAATAVPRSEGRRARRPGTRVHQWRRVVKSSQCARRAARRSIRRAAPT